MENNLEIQESKSFNKNTGSTFSDIETFKNAQRMAGALCQSSLVPVAYKNNVPNTMVAMEMAVRIGISPMMVMQNLDIIQGKPSWRSSFIISALNSCGRFTPLRFQFEGTEGNDEYGCRAYAHDSKTNEKVIGPKVSWKMVKAEGWLAKKGSKWVTMPELMFQYRAASFFGRLFAPDILTGMGTAEEVVDIRSNEISGLESKHDQEHQELSQLYNDNAFGLTEDERIHIERIIDQKEVLSYAKAKSLLNEKMIPNE